MVLAVVLAVRESIQGVALCFETGPGEDPAIATLGAGHPVPSIGLTPPRMAFTCRLEEMTFAPGRDELHLAVSLPDAAVTLASSGCYDAATPFAVIPILDEVPDVSRFRRNVVHLA